MKKYKLNFVQINLNNTQSLELMLRQNKTHSDNSKKFDSWAWPTFFFIFHVEIENNGNIRFPGLFSFLFDPDTRTTMYAADSLASYKRLEATRSRRILFP